MTFLTQNYTCFLKMILWCFKQVEYFLFITISWQNCDKAILNEGDISGTKLRHSYKFHNSLHPELFFCTWYNFITKLLHCHLLVCPHYWQIVTILWYNCNGCKKLSRFLHFLSPNSCTSTQSTLLSKSYNFVMEL